ncbi:ABC transporter ATP-binding protein [Desulfoferrobacter suflitae]|uniref:ABC transporter ATP-binding protein n=1 Tax=Desulfoferrobacter suflitae TaxID=2865782 RepID=UPI00216421DF|nr:ABC transporter ATP-binding protein [Desulfoferrobacter suflitae]MCK8600203.1 ABC transporter ATP-binding protein [Desulfoferrobacter suflitae]
MTDTLIKVENVSKKFCRSLKRSLRYGIQDLGNELIGRRHGGNGELREDEFWAVKDVSFEVKRGECLGLIGRNGAGKTTLLRMLNGLIKPDKGRIEMRGRVGALIALGAGFNPILTGRENIYVNGAVLGLSKKETGNKIEEIIDFAEIREFIDSPVQSYSAGMTVRLGFAVAAALDPHILLLDEVLAVGDVGFQAKCLNTLSDFRKKGTGFVLVSHNMHQISRYCDQLLYLKGGHVAHCGDVESGIKQFLQHMDANQPSIETEATEWSRVYGSGKVILKNATFLDKDGLPVNHIRTGDTFSLAIDYECPGELVSDTILDIVIRDKEGTLYQGTSADYGVDFGLLSQAGRMIVTFEHMPANSTEVQFFLTLLNAKNGEIYDWKRHIRLKITNNAILNGRVSLTVSWALSNPILNQLEHRTRI